MSLPRVYNLQHGSPPPGTVYCGRGSVAGNPFVIGPLCTREQACNRYERWAPKQDWWRGFLASVRGKNLSCYCKPLRCHCDFILQEANKEEPLL